MPVGSASPAYLGVLDEFPYWNAVFDLYRRDELQPAAELMEKLGIGMYGDYAIVGDIIFLEAATSSESEIIRVSDHLEIEVIPGQLEFAFDDLAKVVEGAYRLTRDKFGVTVPPVDTLLTLLVKEGQVPTAALRDGYFTPKQSYGKICLSATNSVEDIAMAFSHELAYQFAFEITRGLSDLWLLEAATALVGDSKPGDTRRLPDSGELDRTLCLQEDDDAALAEVRRAREDCRQVGAYLLSQGQAQKFVSCLAAHREHLVGNVTGHALHETYGMYTKEVFYHASQSFP